MSEIEFKTETSGFIEQTFESGPVSGFSAFMRDVRSYVEMQTNKVGRPCRVKITVEVERIEESEVSDQ